MQNVWRGGTKAHLYWCCEHTAAARANTEHIKLDRLATLPGMLVNFGIVPELAPVGSCPLWGEPNHGIGHAYDVPHGTKSGEDAIDAIRHQYPDANNMRHAIECARGNIPRFFFLELDM